MVSGAVSSTTPIYALALPNALSLPPCQCTTNRNISPATSSLTMTSRTTVRMIDLRHAIAHRHLADQLDGVGRGLLHHPHLRPCPAKRSFAPAVPVHHKPQHLSRDVLVDNDFSDHRTDDRLTPRYSAPPSGGSTRWCRARSPPPPPSTPLPCQTLFRSRRASAPQTATSLPRRPR